MGSCACSLERIRWALVDREWFIDIHRHTFPDIMRVKPIKRLERQFTNITIAYPLTNSIVASISATCAFGYMSYARDANAAHALLQLICTRQDL
jgi:hypothetical protein